MRYTKSGPKLYISLFCFFLFSAGACSTQNNATNPASDEDSISTQLTNVQQEIVRVGAEVLVNEKLDLLKGKSIAIIANQTSLVFGGMHIVDTLHNLGIDIKRIFAPEHGFRGDHDAGAVVKDGKDIKTGIEITSLYGANKKPGPKQLADIDMVIFDIQDVGARFYTYITTMAYAMEACAENKVRFMVLDRPNPNGWYVDGPVMEDGNTSFVGAHESVPIVHGMTVGEYAKMVNGEDYLAHNAKCILTVIPCAGYHHKMKWEETGLDWIPPSPNLPSEFSAYLYPMLCWYEAMPISIGRGTETPFEIMGAPWHEGYRYAWRKDSVMEFKTPSRLDLFGLEMEMIRFTPVSIPGKSKYPKYQDELCYGVRFINRVDGASLFKAGLSLLDNLQEETGNVSLNEPLFRDFFKRLVGTEMLQNQVENRIRAEDIYQSWEKGKQEFKSVRKKYLLYQDFE